MKNEHSQVFLVTNDYDNSKTYVTLINEPGNVKTWASGLVGYEHLPKGTRVEIIN